MPLTKKDYAKVRELIDNNMRRKKRNVVRIDLDPIKKKEKYLSWNNFKLLVTRVLKVEENKK